MKRLIKGDRVAIVSCSNAIAESNRHKIEKLICVLKENGLDPVAGKCVFERRSVFGGTAEERAEELMKFYRDTSIHAIFDVSGGDIANEILPYLDFDIIASGEKEFWGYSDLTTILNAIYTKTGKKSVLYQVRNLIKEDAVMQQERFRRTVFEGSSGLQDISCRFVQGSSMEGYLVGGNLRCLLKLAGTPYWPDMKDKILLLESWGGREAQMTTYLSQLKQMGVYEQVSGILLGTFTTMQMEERKPDIIELVKNSAGNHVPIAKTEDIGHGSDSRAAYIGAYYRI